MRKNFSFMLMATALLISGNLWAGGDMNNDPDNAKAQIGTQYYSSVAKAVADVPETGVQTTIIMINDENVGVLGEGGVPNTFCTIKKAQNVLLDLNGCEISAQVDNKNQAHAMFENKGILTIQDSKDFDKNGSGGGKLYLLYTPSSFANYAHNVILNAGTLVVKSGFLHISMPNSPTYGYDVDNSSGSSDAFLTIEGGKFQATRCCIRSYAQSTTYANVVNAIGGVFISDQQYIFFAQEPSGNQSGLLTLNISGGNFTCPTENAVIDLYTTGLGCLQNTSIAISGGVANCEMILIEHGSFKADETKSLKDQLQPLYTQIFNITGGTFLDADYKIWTQTITYDASTGHYDTDIEEEDTKNLPTIINGAYYKPNSTNNPNVETEIIISHIDNKPATQASDINNENEAYTISSYIEIPKETNAKAYNITVKDNAIVTVKNGAVLTVGDGGIKVEEGSKIIVEAGGILKVGAYGFEGTGADALVVYSDPTASGVVAISPMAYLHNTPALKIVMNSNAYTNPNDAADYYWQFFAIPTSGDCNLQWASGAAPYMKKFDVGTQAWVSITNPKDLNTPFVGYAMTNDCPARGAGQYTMNGNLVGRENAAMKLTAPTAGAETGWNLLGNSYLAPIDVNELVADIKVGDNVIGKAVYAYNSYNGQYVMSNKTVKGTIYISETESKSFTSIAPMSAFFLENKGSGEAGFTINYAKTVYGKENSEPMMAPARSSDAKVLNIHVQAGKYADDLYFVQNGDEDDNVTKLMNDDMNIYALVGDEKQISVNADNMSNMPVAFQAGNAVEYTMTFSNGLNDNFVLVDNANGARVAMTDGATYTFVATPNSTDANRFEIRKITNVVTNDEEVTVAPAAEGIYTTMGQYIGETAMWNSLPAGMYIVDGVRMAK